MLKKIVQGISAGIVICLGGSIFLACDNRYVSAILFSVALLGICNRGYSLFTGKVGFMVEKHGAEEWSVLMLGLVGNLAATILGGLVIRTGLPALGTAAETIVAAKLTQTALQTFIRASFCGFLMYLAVSIFKENKSPLGILYCIPVFILSGFEHSIADMFYFAAANEFSGAAWSFLFFVLLGNAAGALLLCFLTNFGKDGAK